MGDNSMVRHTILRDEPISLYMTEEDWSAIQALQTGDTYVAHASLFADVQERCILGMARIKVRMGFAGLLRVVAYGPSGYDEWAWMDRNYYK